MQLAKIELRDQEQKKINFENTGVCWKKIGATNQST